MTSDSKKNTQLGLSGRRNASLESITSITSQGGRSTRRTSQSDQSMSGVADIRQFGPHLFDCVAVIIRCPKHAKYGLCKIGGSRGNAFWFAYKSLRTTDSWYINVLKLCKRVLHVSVGGSSRKSNLSFSVPELVHILRIQLPQYYEYVLRVTFFTELTYDAKYPSNCCQSNANITWFGTEDIITKHSVLMWGPEPEVFIQAIQSHKLEKGNYTEITIMDALKFAPKSGDKAVTYQEEMFRASGYHPKDITTIFSEFIQHCYPSQYMSLPAFTDYMTKAGLAVQDMDLRCLYRAFSFNFMAYLSFYEFSLGLASMEKSASHGGNCGKLRTRYIYRYYSKGPLSGGNDFLDYESMRRITRDILRHREPHKTSAVSDIEADIKNNYQCLGVAYKEKVSFAQFEKSVGAMKMRGTSSLFRCSTSPVSQLRLKPVYGELTLMRTPDDVANAAKARDAACAKCRQKKYTLAKHIVKTLADGTIVNPQLTKQSDVKQMPKEMMHLSNEAFTATTPANVILDSLKAFALKYGLYVSSAGSKSQKTSSGSDGSGSGSGSTTSTSGDWASQSTKLRLQQTIKHLLNQSIESLKRCARVIKINSPCYVLGDIHGNLRDLMTYEQILWRMAPTCISSSYLFLGDIVDRGEYGLECILYLLANKLIAPHRFHLLRGNHELRSVQLQFTFKKECDVKFGVEVGAKIWEHLNQVFDVMPVCAVIDESIFCAHGGIPTHATLIKQLYAIPCPLSAPENDEKHNENNRLAWEMLWNDPITQSEYQNGYALLKSQSSTSELKKYAKGFLPNTKRGTAYFFSDEAVDTFLAANQLSHVIRAHEMIPPGYAFHMNGKVITIFSCSNYGNANNESACALVDQSKIRIIQLDTSNNR